MGRDKILAKEQKSTIAKLSNVISSHSNADSDREEKINKRFEWILQGVHILGQVDNFISNRTKDIIQRLDAVYNKDDKNAYKYFH